MDIELNDYLAPIWERLGLPHPQQRVAGLSWEMLLRAAEASKLSTVETLTAAGLRLCVSNNPEAALELVKQAEPTNPLYRWMLLQLAIVQRSPELLDEWLTGFHLSDADPLDDRSSVAIGAFARLTLLGLPARSGKGLPPASVPAARIAFQLVLMNQQRWADLAVAFLEEPKLDVAAAHLLGDVLGRYEKQAELLREVEGDARLLAGETLLELAVRGKGKEELDPALAHRQQTLGGITVEAGVNAALMALRGNADAPPLPSLDDVESARAWRHLCSMVERLTTPGPVETLTTLYEQQAAQSAPRLSSALTMRVAEQQMAAQRWEAAHGTLLGLARSRFLPSVAQAYTMICCCCLQRWDELATKLVGLAGEEASFEEAAPLLHLALMAATKDTSGSAGLLRRIRRAVVKQAFRASGNLAALLHAVHHLHGKKREATALLSLLFDRCANAEEAVLFGLTLAGTELSNGRADRAQVALELVKKSGSSGPLLSIIKALTHAHQRNWPAAAGELEELSRNLPAAEAVTVLRTAAHLTADRGGDVGQAIRLLETALTLDPTAATILEELAALHLQNGDPIGATQMLSATAEATQDPDRSADILCAMAEIHGINDVTQAERAFRRAIEQRPGHRRSLEGLARLLKASGRPEELPAVLKQLIALTAGEDQRELEEGLCAVHLELWQQGHGPKDAESCVEACAAVLKQDNGNERVLGILTTVCEWLECWDEILRWVDRHQAKSVTALRALASAYRGTGRMEDLADVLQALTQVAQPRERYEAAMEAGEIWVRLGGLARAEQCYQFAVESFRDVKAFEYLSDILRGQSRWVELIGVLEQLVEVTSEERRCPIHLEIGRLYAHRGDRRSAIRHHELAVELDASSQEGLRSLADLLEQEHSPSDLARVLEKLLVAVEGTEEDLQVTLRLGGVYRELEDERSVLRVAARIHRLFPGDREAAVLVEEVYLQHGWYADLCEFYERRIQFLEEQKKSRDEVVQLLRQKGNYELSKLGAVAEAVETLTRVVEMTPNDEETLSLLGQVLSEAGDWQRLMAVFEKRANQLDDQTAKIKSLHQAAAIAAKQLNDEAESERLYGRIYRIDPSDAESFAYLRGKLEVRRDHLHLVDLYVDRAQRVRPAAKVAECFAKAAHICEQINDLARAKDLYHQALEVQANWLVPLQSLSRIYEALEDWDRFLEVTGRLTQLESDAAAKALLYFKYGSVLETKYHREEEAAKHYKAAIRTSGLCLPAIHSLREIHARRSSWPQVIETLKLESHIWSDAKGRAAVLSQIAEIYRGKLHDPQKAFEYYQQAIETHPENLTAGLALFEVSVEEGNRSQAVKWGQVVAKQVASRGNKAQQADFFVKWSGVLQEIGQSKDAAKYYVRALGLRPGQQEALFGLLKLCREAPDAYDYAEAFADLLKDANKREDLVATAIISAGMGALAERRADPDTAIKLYERAIEFAGEQIELARPMADLLVLVGREEEAVALVGRCRQDVDFRAWVSATLWLVDYYTIWRQDYDSAIGLCQEAIDAQPNLTDVRVRLARAAMMQGAPKAARAQYEAIEKRLSVQGDAPDRARYHHCLALAADLAGDRTTAEKYWKQATELLPAWMPPYLAWVRRLLLRGQTAEATAVVGAAVATVPEKDPDLLRLRILLHQHVGETRQAVDLCRQLATTNRAEHSDRIVLSRLLAQVGESAQAVEMLRQVVVGQPDGIPALEDLERLWAASGAARQARRARAVLALATGSEAIPLESPTLGPLPDTVWQQCLVGVSTHPVDGVWGLLSSVIEIDRGDQGGIRIDPVDEPTVNVVRTRMNMVFGGSLSLASGKALAVPWFLDGEWLVVSEDLCGNAEAWPFLMAVGLSVRRAGYVHLFEPTSQQQRFELGRGVARLLCPDKGVSVLAPVIGKLPAKTQRQLTAHVSRHRMAADSVDELARTWLLAIETAAMKSALLVTDDIQSAARLLAVQRGISLDLVEKGGLPGALPEMVQMIDFYLSERFEAARSQLEGRS